MSAELVPLTVKEWKPHKRQEEFIRLPGSVPEAFYGGAAGGGKSDVLMMLPILKEYYKHPKFMGVLFRRTFPELEETLINSTLKGIGVMPNGEPGPSYKDFGGDYNQRSHAWTFPSGAVIKFDYSQRESDVAKHDSAQFQYLGIDELTHFTSYQYFYLMHRVRTPAENLKPLVRTGSNPGNIGHGWVRERFVEPAPGGRVLIEGVLKDGRVLKRIFIPSRVTDNPHLMRADPTYMDRLMLLPEAERKAKLEGDWWTFAGQVYSEFRAFHHEHEPENAIHVIPSFPIPAWWPKLLVIDWGFAAITYAMWVAIAPNGRVFVYREYAARKKSIAQWGADIRRICSLDENIVLGIIDPSSQKREGHPKSIKQQAEDAIGMKLTLADNDRISGKMLIHDFLRWEPRPKRFVAKTGYDERFAQRLYRMYGTEALQEYEALFIDDYEDTSLIPRLQIFSDCPLLIEAIPLCVYDENRTEDIAEFKGDDPIDTLRYAAKAVDRYVLRAADDWERYKRIDRAVGEFQRTGNYTDLDRSLSTVEQDHGSSGAVSRRSLRGFLSTARRASRTGRRWGGSWRAAS